MRKSVVAGFALAVAIAVSPVLAADFVNLEWGEFKLAFDSTAKPKSVTSLNKDGDLGMSMALEGFTASADGAKMEGSSSLAGEFVIQQPSYAKLPAMSVQIRGTLIKTAGTTAELIVNIGSAEQRIEWKPEEVSSGPYSKILSVDIKDGQVPVPFPVNVQAFVKRPNQTGAVLLTVESIDIRVGQPSVANYFTPDHREETQALAIAPPSFVEERRNWRP